MTRVRAIARVRAREVGRAATPRCSCEGLVDGNPAPRVRLRPGLRPSTVLSGVLFIALVAACSPSNGTARDREVRSPAVAGDAASAPTSAPAEKVGAGTASNDAGGATMEILYEDMPDDSWRRAGEVAIAQWKGFADTGKVVMKPLRSPDGVIVPYLLEMKLSKPDGTPTYHGGMLVWDGALLNLHGGEVTTRYLHAIGFPGKQLLLGHLVEILFLTDAVPSGWLRPPVPAGWDALTRPVAQINEVPATLEYERSGALLTLYRSGRSSGRGGGWAPPPTERLQVRFKSDATFVMDAARRRSSGQPWEPFSLQEK